MGLDNFTSDDNSVSESSDNSSNTSTSKVNKLTKVNQPTMANQSFGPESHVSPRDIKYQIKSFGFNWIKQFSTRRSNDGEVAMYATWRAGETNDVTLAIFTGIRSFDSEHPYDNELDIDVTLYDLEQKEVIHKESVESNDNWKNNLHKCISNVFEMYNSEYSDQESINNFTDSS